MIKVFSYLFAVFLACNAEYAVAEQPNQSKQNQEQIVHVVQSGENLYRISLKYGVSQKDLMEENNIKNAASIFAGQKIKIPKNNNFAEKQKTEENKNATNNNTNTNNNIINTKQQQQPQQIGENVALNKVENVKDQQLNLVNKIDETTFIWPSRGSIISKFNHQMSAGKLEGVIIGGENGSVVRASSSGEVVYNDKVNGYENVILIHHYNGFFTAYGFTDPLVSVGDKIKKGQVIAYMTKNKQSKRSQLYFSIRKNGKSYDPEKIIQTKISN